MELPPDIKHLYKEWMEEEYDALLHQGSKMSYTYKRAIESLMQSPMQIRLPSQLKPLKFVGDSIVQRMTRKLEKYCTNNGYLLPRAPESPKRSSSNKGKRALSASENDDSQGENTKTKKKRAVSKKPYVPQKDSAAYAMIKALYTYDPDQRGLTKETLISYCAEFTEISFVKNPSTYYSGWSSMKTLLDKDLIQTVGRPLHYLLTEEGTVLAETLNKIDNGSSSTISTPPVTSLAATIANDPSIRPNVLQSITNRPVIRGVPMEASSSKPSQLTNSVDTNYTSNSENYSIWSPNDYDIVLLLDNREIRSREHRNFFSDKLTQLGIRHDVRSLAVGDGVWVAKNKATGSEAVLDFMFERKRLDDFASSIVDGRYVEQKSRLKSAKLKNVFYVIEEQSASDISRFAESMKTGISLNLTNADFHIERTKDSDDTVSFMRRATASIKKYYSEKHLIIIEPRNIYLIKDYGIVLDEFKERFKDKSTTHDCVYSFSTFQSVLSKTGMSTVKEIFIKMLMTVRGVSLEKAIVIQEAYKTPIQFLNAYSEKATIKQKQEMLFEKFKNEYGTRKIGKALSTKIYEVWGC